MGRCTLHCPGIYLDLQQINAHTSEGERDGGRKGEQQSENVDFLFLVEIGPSFTNQKQNKNRLIETETKGMVTRREGLGAKGKGIQSIILLQAYRVIDDY